MRKLVPLLIVLLMPLGAHAEDLLGVTAGSGSNIGGKLATGGGFHPGNMACDATDPRNCAPVDATKGLTVQGSAGGTAIPVVSSASAATATTTNVNLPTAGTYVQVLAANASRKGCSVQLPLDAATFAHSYLGTVAQQTAAGTVSGDIAIGGSLSCLNGGNVYQGAISVTGTTNSQKVYVVEE